MAKNRKARKKGHTTTKQTNSKKTINVQVSKTLQEALFKADMQNAKQIVYEGIVYQKEYGKWIEFDAVTELIAAFPNYKKLYKESLQKANNNVKMAKSLVLAVLLTNKGNGSEWDLSNKL